MLLKGHSSSVVIHETAALDQFTDHFDKDCPKVAANIYQAVAAKLVQDPGNLMTMQPKGVSVFLNYLFFLFQILTMRLQYKTVAKNKILCPAEVNDE